MIIYIDRFDWLFISFYFIEEDLCQDQGLWILAQSLSALYSAGSEERLWVEGVLTRKKSLGL